MRQTPQPDLLSLGAELTDAFGDLWSLVAPPPVASLADERMDAASSGGQPRKLGARRSFVPLLGESISQASQGPFFAYISVVDADMRIGYVRIPHYSYGKSGVAQFEKIIDQFERHTDALIVDQVENPGGNIFAMYKVASTLATRPLTVPTHQLKISDDLFAAAEATVAMAEAGATTSAAVRPSSESLSYARAIISEVKAGRGAPKLSKPIDLGGVTHISPAKNHYTKNVYVLINELTLSAPEFLAAILQDNKRATLFGERTAGAGGCVREISVGRVLPMEMSLTWTIARRTNGAYIENRGVRPDVKYSVTAEDIRSGYDGYRTALLGTVVATAR
jgi:C-terminal processing protease CtpA/Prc